MKAPAPRATGSSAIGRAGDLSGARRRWLVAGWALLVAGAFLLRIWAPGPVTETVDEATWLLRSDRFDSAIAEGDFATASASSGNAATMPGVTTMWAGTIGRGVLKVGDAFGLVDLVEAPSERSPQILRASRAVVSLWWSLSLGIFVIVAARLVGLRAAAIAGLLLATEPFLVGHGGVLHTDALVSIFAAVSVAAFAAAYFGHPTRPPESELVERRARPRPSAGAPAHLPLPSQQPPDARPSMPLVVVSAVFAGLALATKLNALVVLGAGPATVILTDLIRRRRSERRWRAVWDGVRTGIIRTSIWAVVALAVTVAMWPAMWVAPTTELRQVRASLSLAGEGHITFFRGEVTRDPGPLYYPVAMAFRLTPWMLVGAVVAVLAVAVHLVRRWQGERRSAWPSRSALAIFVLTPLAYLVVLSLASKKLDRYFLPAVPFLAVLVGCATRAGVVAFHRRWGRHGWERWAAGIVVVLLVAHTVALAPYAISYASPLVGGQRAAERTILLGWGEGTEQLGETLQEREGDRCPEVRVAAPYFLRAVLPCGQLHGLSLDEGGMAAYDYAILYVTWEQRRSVSDEEAGRSALKDYAPFEAAVRRDGRLVDRVRIGGVTYAELWALPER